MPKADLHIHTYYSDGYDSPERVIELARQAGLCCISITDHDVLDAYPEAIPAAEKAGVELIPGLELSASWDGREVHMVGLFIDLEDVSLKELLTRQRVHRLERIKEMIVRLKNLGFNIELEEVLGIAGKGAVGRPHIAQALLKHGYVSSNKEAFEKYIGTGCPAFVPGSQLDPAQAIDAIRKASGIPVLAHPVYLKDDSLIEKWQSEGLIGLEVFHSSHDHELTCRYEKFAERLGLLKAGGTDYHGPSKEGGPIGSVTVDYKYVEELKKWKRDQMSASCS